MECMSYCSSPMPSVTEPSLHRYKFALLRGSPVAGSRRNMTVEKGFWALAFSVSKPEGSHVSALYSTGLSLMKPGTLRE